MTEQDPDDASPWERDDWTPDSAVPDPSVFAPSRTGAGAGLGAGLGGDDDPHDRVSDDDELIRARPLWHRVVAGGIIAALVIGSAGALVRCGSDTDVTAAPTATGQSNAADSTGVTSETDTSETVSSDPSSPDGADANTPASTPASAPPTSALTITTSPVGDGDGALVDVIVPFEEGQMPQWAERTITVPDALTTMAPTEAVTLSQAGILSVTEFPSGRTRSLDVSAIGSATQLAVGDGTIVVFGSNELIQIRDAEPVVRTSVPNGIIFVQARPGASDFVLTSPAIGADTFEEDRALLADGSIVELDDRLVDDQAFWLRTFSPSGDMLVTRPGGVYAITPDGAADRISAGDLIATGTQHWAIEECDAELRCGYSVIAWDTGEVTGGDLDAIRSFGFIDPATSISPDGRSIAYRSDDNGTGRRQILDVATGTSIDAGRLDRFVYPDTWAADSSGLFIADRYLGFVDRVTGTATDIEDLDRVRSVATGTFAAQD